MECYFLSKPIDARGGPVRHHIWRERSLFELKKSINDQAIVIRIKSDFQQLRLEKIKRRVLKLLVMRGQQISQI